MATAHMLKVFCDSGGNYGDVASVIVDEERALSDDDRQALAWKLDTGETIFINDVATSSISVVHPQGEIDFAGVGVLGAAWLLGTLRDEPPQVLCGRGGDIRTWQNGGMTWVRAAVATLPDWNYQQLASATEVERIKLNETADMEHTMLWGWIDEVRGHIRARTFAADWDIPEAMGNGSGAMLLAHRLGKAIELHHGEGAVIYASPAPHDQVDIGGRVIELPSRDI